MHYFVVILLVLGCHAEMLGQRLVPIAPEDGHLAPCPKVSRAAGRLVANLCKEKVFWQRGKSYGAANLTFQRSTNSAINDGLYLRRAYTGIIPVYYGWRPSKRFAIEAGAYLGLGVDKPTNNTWFARVESGFSHWDISQSLGIMLGIALDLPGDHQLKLRFLHDNQQLPHPWGALQLAWGFTW